MPTHDETRAFLRDYESLTPQQQDRLDSKREEFVADLIAMQRGGRQRFRPGLRVKRVQGASHRRPAITTLPPMIELRSLPMH